MKSTLYLKFIIIYFIFGFLTIFVVATLSSELVTTQLENNEITFLNEKTNLISAAYLPFYFASDGNYLNADTKSGVQRLLHTSRVSLDATIWILDPDGNTLAYAVNSPNTPPPKTVDDFDPIEYGNNKAFIGNYHSLLEEDSITVIAPITSGFQTKGYLLVHKPYSFIEDDKAELMSIITITAALIFILSFSILLAIHLLIYVPLRRITEAATQYASGNLNHEVPVRTEDEMGYLSASLNYMSAQLRDMEDYQKKFIGNVSHDFRSPLTSIKGYIEALDDGTIPIEMQEKYFKIILFETERLADLTKDLLTLNEFDTKELLLNKTSFDIHDMIKNVASAFEGTCTSKRVSIELLLITKALRIYADKSKIQQVLYNLIDNAIKFSDFDSSITIETSLVNEKVFISVKDSGIGISKENLNRIWERFYKSDSSRGKDKKGTGLGLAIVKEIIQAHNENINVISTEGVGTQFVFSLPKNRPIDRSIDRK